jgi:seryl-tRNA synthetase
MLDPALLRKDLDAVVRRLASRGFAFPMDRFNELESRRKSVQTETEKLQAQRNALAKQIGALKSRGEDASAVLAESQAIPAKLKALEIDLTEIQSQLSDMLMAIPNLPHESVPQGADSEGNIEVRRWVPQPDSSGDPQRLAFEPRDHVTLGEAIGLDFDTAAKHAGSANWHARLHGVLHALHCQCLDTHGNGPIAQIQK